MKHPLTIGNWRAWERVDREVAQFSFYYLAEEWINSPEARMTSIRHLMEEHQRHLTECGRSSPYGAPKCREFGAIT